MGKISGGVDADLLIVARNPGTATVTDSSGDELTPRPEVEKSLPSSSCGKFGMLASRLTPAVLEAEGSTTRKELTLENLLSSMRGRFSSPLSRSVPTELVVACLAPDQGMKEVNPLNIGKGVAR